MLSGSFSDVTFSGRIKTFPGGFREVMACSKPIFRAEGWEERVVQGEKPSKRGGSGVGDASRAQRRARAAVRDLALSNPMKYFVTLTLDPSRIDRYDMTAITRKLNAWLSNQVQRRGLSYILVPERHKDGAIHFHGFFNDALPVIDSGTIIPAGGGKPKRPRSAAQRAAVLAAGGRVVYNLPGWSLGFTTALELYGEYPKAVSYVCKYIGKQGEKPGGRWYYSGGQLQGPTVTYAPLEFRDVAEMPGAHVFEVEQAGASFAVVFETAATEGGELV